jgi:3-deoxy-D-manno-octulosonate 8-phosphate phosphatase (KDO 8-P phosphatase)
VNPGHLEPFQAALRSVRILVLDVDGVLTDGRLYYGPKGEQLKVFHVRDGYGIKKIQEAGITVAIISGRRSEAVARRARELGIRHVAQGVDDKSAALARLSKARKIPVAHCACIGDDTPDVPMLEACGVGIAVADAHPDALAAAALVTRTRGGHGAVREVCDWLLAARPA